MLRTRRMARRPAGEILRIALVHDWVSGLRGGERVLHELATLYPGADLYTLFYQPGTTTPAIDDLRVRASALNRWRWLRERYRGLLPLYPWAIRRFALANYDAVVSIHHAVAKAVTLAPGTRHLCYCLTPMRYIWDQTDAYWGRGLRRAAATPLLATLRRFDCRSATTAQVTRFVAISHYVAERIRRHYGRDADVVYPPVDVERFAVDPRGPADYYLLVTSFGHYKRAELAVAACAQLGRPLLVVGDGPGRHRLEAAAPSTIRFLGRVPEAKLPEIVARCRALLQPQEEDFGIAALEVQAAGRPVIAFERGGAAETVCFPGTGSVATGLGFAPQSSDALAAAILRFEAVQRDFAPHRIRHHALSFSTARFRREVQQQVESLCASPRIDAMGRST